MKLIDLHVHTTASDGTFTPTEAVLHAKEKNLTAIAITDHDTADGVAEAVEAGKKYGVEVIPGIEVSVDYQGYGIHILGYFIDPKSPALGRLLKWVVEERERRNSCIIELMRSDGIDISCEGLKESFPNAVIGRPHLAAALVERGLASSVQEGFDKYLSSGKSYYLRRAYIPLDEAFDVIKGAGGKAVFAHPLQYRMEEPELLALTARLKRAGAKGMECVYSGYTPQQVEYLKGVAAHYDLCITGGSDFHGTRKPHIDMGSGTGGMAVPYELLEKLKER